MAEGARLTLLYVDNQQNHDMVGILVPIVSGVLWNVLTRIGCLDRFLHCVSRGRWKPNNCSKLLRESGAAYLSSSAVSVWVKTSGHPETVHAFTKTVASFDHHLRLWVASSVPTCNL